MTNTQAHLKCAKCGHAVIWLNDADGQRLYHFHQDINFPEAKRFVYSTACYCGCRKPRD